MEKFYIIRDTKLINDYKEWEEDDKKICQAFVELKEEFGIESSEYYPNTLRLKLCPTNSDLEKFRNSLLSNSTEVFKARSKENKRWLELMKEKQIKGLRKPFIKDYLSAGVIGGKMWSTLFEIEGTLYGHFKTVQEKKILPQEGFIEIKASEYYKTIEDYEEKNGIMS